MKNEQKNNIRKGIITSGLRAISNGVKTKKILKKEELTRTHTWGKWTPQPLRTHFIVCACGNKYIKTRKGQTRCIWCICQKAAQAPKKTQRKA